MDGRVGIVAVGVVRDVASRLQTGCCRWFRRVSVPVSVRVAVVGTEGHSLVDLPIAILVHSVTGLRNTRMDGRIFVVAIGAAGDVASRFVASQTGGDR